MFIMSVENFLYFEQVLFCQDFILYRSVLFFCMAAELKFRCFKCCTSWICRSSHEFMFRKISVVKIFTEYSLQQLYKQWLIFQVLNLSNFLTFRIPLMSINFLEHLSIWKTYLMSVSSISIFRYFLHFCFGQSKRKLKDKYFPKKTYFKIYASQKYDNNQLCF